MTRRINFRSLAEVEIAKASSWYEGEKPGLGKDFLRQVEECVSAIAENPFRFRRAHKETRRARIDRFPYGLLYRVTEDEIVVVACMHSRRHPRRWQGRR